MNENIFTHNLEDLLYLSKQKNNIINNLKKNYIENKHFIKTKNSNKKMSGGHNKINYLLIKECFELLKNSFNLRNRYIVNLSENIKQVNICMCIENQTIGFIENIFKDVTNLKRQYMIDKYKVDLYFIDYKLVIECDENNHINRDPINEKIRENFIKYQGNTIIRYNPNEKSFDLSNVLKDINKILWKK
jgi:RNase P subunit RPR2